MLLVVSLAALAAAQTDQQPLPRPARPFRGLFGGAQLEPSRSQTLDLNLSFLGGYDDNVTASTGGRGPGLGDPRFGESGGTANASASLAYRRSRRENVFFAGVRSGFRYFPSISELNTADYSASAGFSLKPSRRTALAANQDISYQPFFSLSTLPVFTGPPASGLRAATVDYAFSSRPSVNYGSSVDASYDVGRRTHASADYSLRGLDFTGESDDGRMRQHDASVGLARDITRRVRLGGRYTYGRGDSSYFGPSYATRSQAGELMFDYGRTLRARRRVNVGFSAGYGRVETISAAAEHRFDRRVTGSARLSADVGRTWVASADFRRGVRHLPGMPAPVLSDDVQARLAGLIGRRVDVSIAGQYSKGETGVALSGFDSAGGTAQVRWALNRLTAVTGNYVFYRYEFPLDAVLPAGLDRRFSRHAFRLGVDVWLPLYR